MSKKEGMDIPVFSVRDMLDTWLNYNTTEKGKDDILYFISEVTGLSVDALMQNLG